MKNFELIKKGLINTYNKLEENSTFYLTEEQIEGILNYIEVEIGEDIDICYFIDNQLINGYGFDKDGNPIIEEQY